MTKEVSRLGRQSSSLILSFSATDKCFLLVFILWLLHISVFFQNAYFLFLNHSMTTCDVKSENAFGSEKPWSDWDALSLLYSLELPLGLPYIYCSNVHVLNDRFMVTNCFNKQIQSRSWEWEPGDIWVVLQLLELPHHLVPHFSPVKTGKGGLHKKLCLQVKTYFVHVDQYWHSRFILTVVFVCFEEGVWWLHAMQGNYLYDVQMDSASWCRLFDTWRWECFPTLKKDENL